MNRCQECGLPAKRKFCSRACRREKENRWHRKHYRAVRQFDEARLAQNEAKRKERKAKSDPNIEREYHQERNFRFGFTFNRYTISRVYGLPTLTAVQMENATFVVIRGGKCRRIESWRDLQRIQVGKRTVCLLSDKL